ncbi:MAG: histidyl-tRNA synthetase, histidyl-tRNA synthetase [Candidatus Parcubacteria bacterium]|jgi:histidyl-tRNA synthetase
MKLSTDNYKGVRDFYPEDYKVLEYIFTTWKSVLSRYGYEQYDASPLEYAEIYKQKSGEEIVNEQTYTFIDKGGREISLRPEMTPTVARMVARKHRELSYPLRWFSIPNVFRYERPQKGRLREHWQLNVDMFGLDSIYGDVELIKIAYDILKTFGLNDSQFVIKINNRKMLNAFFENTDLSDEQKHATLKLLDRKNKVQNFDEQLKEIAGKNFKFNPEMDEETRLVVSLLQKQGISNIEFDPYMVRGFDYYNGIIFEIFDTSPANNRSIFGGGRYNNLTQIFSSDSVPACGFGMGDVTLRDVLETYDLLPNFIDSIDVYLAPLEETYIEQALTLADELRKTGTKVLVDYSSRKVGDQIKKALSKKSKFFTALGENELKSKKLILKNLSTKKERKLSFKDISKFVKKNS